MLESNCVLLTTCIIMQISTLFLLRIHHINHIHPGENNSMQAQQVHDSYIHPFIHIFIQKHYEGKGHLHKKSSMFKTSTT